MKELKISAQEKKISGAYASEFSYCKQNLKLSLFVCHYYNSNTKENLNIKVWVCCKFAEVYFIVQHLKEGM